MLRIGCILCIVIVAGCRQLSPPDQIFSNAEYSGNVSSLYSVAPGGDGAKATDFRWRDSTGNIHSLSEFKGKVVLLNFWATWCSYCAEEMPDLQAIQDSSSDHVKVIGVSTDITGHSFATVKDYVQSRNIRFQIVVDSSQSLFVNYIAASNGSSALPETFVIGADGTIRFLILGAEPKSYFDKCIASAR